MVDSHVAVSVAQTIFYVPAVGLSLYILFRKSSQWSRLTWLSLAILACMRLAGGPVSIALIKNPSDEHLYIAAAILQNVGAITLLVQALRLFMVILSDKNIAGVGYQRFIRLPWIVFGPAVALLVAGGSTGTDNPNLARILTLAGYILFALDLVVLVFTEAHVWVNTSMLDRRSRKIIASTLLATPFVLVRVLYGVLEVVFEDKAHSVWNPISGSAVLFALVALVPEYVVICIYFGIALVDYDSPTY